MPIIKNQLSAAWCAQSVGPKMSRKFYFCKIKSRDIHKIFKTCRNFFFDDFDDNITYIYYFLNEKKNGQKYSKGDIARNSGSSSSEESFRIDDSNNYGKASTSDNLFKRWEDSQVAIYFEHETKYTFEPYKYKYNGG